MRVLNKLSIGIVLVDWHRCGRWINLIFKPEMRVKAGQRLIAKQAKFVAHLPSAVLAAFSPQHPRRFIFPLAAALVLTLAGCVDLTNQPNDPVVRTFPPATQQSYRNPGHLYAMRGFLGIFSTGMDTLCRKLNQRHILLSAAVADEAAHSYRRKLLQAYRQGDLTGPLILVGHSYGADDQIRTARYLGRHKITVTLLLLLDPVTPPAIPANVQRCVDIYKSHPLTDWLPFLRGVPVHAADPLLTRLTDINLRYAKVGFNTGPVNHMNISAVPGVQKMMLHYIDNSLKRWQAWVMPRRSHTALKWRSGQYCGRGKA